MRDGYPEGLAPRRRGGPPKFVGETLKALVAYLAQEGSTIDKASTIFDCSTSTIEKTLQRERARLRELAEKPPAGLQLRLPGTRRTAPARNAHAAHGA